MPQLVQAIYTDDEVVRLLREKNRRAFDYLYVNYSWALYLIINKIVKDTHTAEDILQETFLKIWNKIDLYDVSKGRLFTWMAKIARNSAIDSLRTTVEIMKSKETSMKYVSDDFEVKQFSIDKIGLSNIINKLRPECQTIVRMVYYQGYKIIDVAELLSMPEGTVKTHIRQAITAMRKEFDYQLA